jgi:hypothetical protein
MMNNLQDDLAYCTAITKKLDATLKKQRRTERKLLKEMGLEKLPYELEKCISDRVFLERMRVRMWEDPKLWAPMLGSLFADLAYQTEKQKD